MDDVILDISIPWLEALDCDLGRSMGFSKEMASSDDLLSPRAFKIHFPYEFVHGGYPHTTTAKNTSMSCATLKMRVCLGGIVRS